MCELSITLIQTAEIGLAVNPEIPANYAIEKASPSGINDTTTHLTYPSGRAAL